VFTAWMIWMMMGMTQRTSDGILVFLVMLYCFCFDILLFVFIFIFILMLEQFYCHFDIMFQYFYFHLLWLNNLACCCF